MHDMILWLLLADALVVVAMIACRGKIWASAVPMRVPSQLAQIHHRRR